MYTAVPIMQADWKNGRLNKEKIYPMTELRVKVTFQPRNAFWIIRNLWPEPYNAQGSPQQQFLVESPHVHSHNFRRYRYIAHFSKKSTFSLNRDIRNTRRSTEIRRISRRCSLSIYFPRLNTPEVEAFQESIFLCIDWTVAIGIEAQRLYEVRSTILYSISRSIAGDYAKGSIEVRVLLRSIYYLANPFTFLYVGSRSKHWLVSFSCIPCRLCEQPRRIGW